MKNFKRRQNIRRVLFSIPFLALFAALTLLFARGAIVVWDKERESAVRVKELEERVEALALRREDLENDISYLKTEDGIKDEIRQRFGVAQVGEHVAIIIDEEETLDPEGRGTIPWYKRLWHAIIGK